MNSFQKTTIYKQVLSVLSEVMEDFNGGKNPSFKEKIEEEAFGITQNTAKAFNQTSKEIQNKRLNKATEGIISIVSLLDLAEKNKKITPGKNKELSNKLQKLQDNFINFNNEQKKILVLSANMGQGHISAARAIKEAMEHNYGYDYDVEIVDFMQLLNSFYNIVTKKYYENSVKFAPGMYKFLYESSDKNVQIVKLLNQLNYPFVLTKIRKYFEEKQADILISTYPVWDYIASDIWKKYRKDAKFISVVTDSITIHNSWVSGDADYHIVANKDTEKSLLNLGLNKEKIKNLGFPIRLKFLDKVNRNKFLKEKKLNPKAYTILLLSTSLNQRKLQKIVNDLMSYDNSINLILITGRDAKKSSKIEKLAMQHNNIKIIGWTDKIHKYIKAADVIITKAGGATVMECIAAAKPMVITSIIPGQEEGNAELIKLHKLGIISGAKDNIAEHVDFIRKHNSIFEKNLKKHSNPKAALQISEFIHKLLT